MQQSAPHEIPPSEAKNLVDHSEPKPVVSVICLTYNHERFIADCIEGFLSQETDFPLEVFIHDDASTDSTVETVRQYADRYPKLITPILQTENQWSLGRDPKAIVAKRCRGRYIAFCEGDDYWTDPKKLQKQVEFLDRNPDYVVSGHAALTIDETGRTDGQSVLAKKHQRDFAPKDLLLDRVMVTPATRVYRNVLEMEPPEKAKVINGDRFLLLLLGEYGGSKYQSDIGPACVRVHSGGIWSARSKSSKRRNDIKTSYWIFRYYVRTRNLYYSYFFFRKIVFLLLRSNIGLLFDRRCFLRIRRQHQRDQLV